MQIWYTVNDPLSKALAANILAYDKQHLQPGNRRENKPSDDSYYLLYKAKVPSVMVECGFMSNVKENNQLKQDVYRRRVAFCILAGLSDTMKTGSYRNGKTEEYVYLQRMRLRERQVVRQVPGCGEWNTMNETRRSNPRHQAQQRRLCLATVETIVGNYRRRGAAYFHRYS